MELKVVKRRNLFKPRWWQFRFRYRLWRMNRNVKALQKRLTPEERKNLAEMNEEFERRILYGENG